MGMSDLNTILQVTAHQDSRRKFHHTLPRPSQHPAPASKRIATNASHAHTRTLIGAPAAATVLLDLDANMDGRVAGLVLGLPPKKEAMSRWWGPMAAWATSRPLHATAALPLEIASGRRPRVATPGAQSLARTAARLGSEPANRGHRMICWLPSCVCILGSGC